MFPDTSASWKFYKKSIAVYIKTKMCNSIYKIIGDILKSREKGMKRVTEREGYPSFIETTDQLWKFEYRKLFLLIASIDQKFG